MKPRGGFEDFIPTEDYDAAPEEVDDSDQSTSLYISIGISIILVFIVVFLFYCLLSKRDLSPCPRKSDFGRRFSQVRNNFQRISRTWTGATG